MGYAIAWNHRTQMQTNLFCPDHSEIHSLIQTGQSGAKGK